MSRGVVTLSVRPCSNSRGHDEDGAVVPYTRETRRTYPGELGRGFQWVWIEIDRNVHVELTVILTTDDVWLHFDDSAVRRLPNGDLSQALKIEHRENMSTGFMVRVPLYSQGIAPAELAAAAQSEKVGSSRKRQ